MSHNKDHAGNGEDQVHITSVRTDSPASTVCRKGLKFLIQQNEESLHQNVKALAILDAFLEPLIGRIVNSTGTPIAAFVKQSATNMVEKELSSEQKETERFPFHPIVFP